jgi:mRNA-degrading endonuclease toxin of MazEF toxin-antitoxin module
MQNIDSVFPGFIPSDFAVIYGLARAGLDKNSLVLCNQLQTVDKSRLLKKIGGVPEERMKLVDMALICSLDLDYR